MPIKFIKIVIEPPSNIEGVENRVLTFDRETKQWNSEDGGFYTNEIALINATNKIRNDHQV